jgi:hypothetical protein
MTFTSTIENTLYVRVSYDFCCGFFQVVYYKYEHFESLVPGLPVKVAVIDLLSDDRQAKEPETKIEIKILN